MRCFLRIAAAAAILVGTIEIAAAQTAYPMLMAVEPVAAQVGKTSEHVVKSRYTMAGAYEVLVSGSGVKAEAVLPPPAKDEKPKPLQELTIRLQVDRDALPGVRDVRIATPNGVSTVGQVVIVEDPVLVETDNNNSAESATPASLPATLCGRIEKAEDVDVFRFQAGAGQTLSFHVQCMRLQDRIHDLQQHADPILSIRNSAGSTIAASDNAFFGDPFISHTFDNAGEYFLTIRDVRYQGNPYWNYCITTAGRPFATTVFPLGVVAGTPTPLEWIGHGRTDTAKVPLTIPADTEAGLCRLPVQLTEKNRQVVTAVVSAHPAATEQADDNDTVETAQAIPTGSGINGRIEADGDIDCFALEAKKGQRYSFEVFARRAGSSLDPHLRLLGEKGNQLQINDDLRLGKRSYADSKIENWTVPADGTYIIEIRDLHLRGGSSFVYFIEVSESQPYFSLYADTDKTPLTPGNSGVVFVRAERKNGFDGEIQLDVDGLPKGVTASCGRILGGKGQDGCIVLTAAPDAKPAVANITISGSATTENQSGKPTSLSAQAVVYQETYQPGGGRGHWPVESHTVSIGAPADIRKVTLSSHDVVLKPGGSISIDVELERAEGFDKNVTLDVAYTHLNTVYGNSLPEGVTIDKSNSKTALTAGATQGKITLTASKTAPAVDKQQIVVMANVSLNFVMKATYASKPVTVSVVP